MNRTQAAYAVSLGLDPDRIPQHIGCIMDGNGRWAAEQGLKRTDGHTAGEEALFNTVDGAIELGIEWFTIYAFSTENWRRPAEEVKFLLNFNEKLLVGRRDELHERGVRIRFLGRRDWRMPKRVLKRMDESEELTKHNTKLQLCVAFNYGGRAEIVDAVRDLVATGVSANKITEKAIAKHLYVPEMPDPDLVLRTSGEQRISNFLIWQLAYAELLFSDVMWPDFRKEHLFDAIASFQGRERRFGAADSE